MKKTFLVMTLLMGIAGPCAPAQASPWPIRAAKAVGKQYVSMAKDCTHHLQFALECAAVFGSMAFDMYSTGRAVHAGLEEGNPLVYGVIGKQPAPHKLAIYGGVTASLELAGLDYLYNTRDVDPKGPYDLGLAGLFAGVHIWAGIHNTNLANACRRAALSCR